MTKQPTCQFVRLGDGPKSEPICSYCLLPLIDCRCSPGERKPRNSIEGVATPDWPYLSSLNSYPWIQTSEGHQFLITDPSWLVISPNEIAMVLSRLVRFGGHSFQPYNVADHSVRVSEILPQHLQLCGLLHDAHEVYSGFGDVCSPAKSLIPEISEIEKSIDVAIAIRFGLTLINLRCQTVIAADRIILATEKRDLMGDEPASWCELPEPLPDRIVPRSSEDAAAEFLRRFEMLTKVEAGT